MFKNNHVLLSLTEKHATENHLFICSCFLALTNAFFSFWVYIKFFFAQILQTRLFFKLEKQMLERRNLVNTYLAVECLFRWFIKWNSVKVIHILLFCYYFVKTGILKSLFLSTKKFPGTPAMAFFKFRIMFEHHESS